jgi:putative phosphoribosyl transferase
VRTDDERRESEMRPVHRQRALPPGRCQEAFVDIPYARSRGPGTLDAKLAIPPRPGGLVMLVCIGDSARASSSDGLAAMQFQRAGFATLQFDPLALDEGVEDPAFTVDVELLATRVIAALGLAVTLPGVRALRMGCWGEGTAAAAGLMAAAQRPDLVSAVVSYDGRPDMLDAAALECVRAPVLIIADDRDRDRLALDYFAAAHLEQVEVTAMTVATRRLHDPAALEAGVRIACAFFDRHLPQVSASPRQGAGILEACSGSAGSTSCRPASARNAGA